MSESPNSVDELCRAARAVVQAACSTHTRSLMYVPDWQIQRLKEALQKVDAEWCAQNEEPQP